MKRVFFGIGLIFAASLSLAQPPSQKVYLKCLPDPTENLPGGMDVMLDKEKLEAVFYPVNETRKMQELETEYVTRDYSSGKLIFEIAINKYTLRYHMFNVMFALTNHDKTVAGQCVIQDKKI